MRYYIIILLSILIVFSSIAIGMVLVLKNPTAFVVFDEITGTNGNEQPKFKLYTKAICNNQSDYVACRDQLYAVCGDMEYKLPGIVNGEANYSKDWTDIRKDR